MNEFDNIYHTDEYRRFMVQKEENISDLCREERTIPLDLGYSLWCGEYAHRTDNGRSYRCRLFSPEGKMIYGYTFYYSSFHETAVQVLSAPEGLYFSTPRGFTATACFGFPIWNKCTMSPVAIRVSHLSSPTCTIAAKTELRQQAAASGHIRMMWHLSTYQSP